MSEIAKEIWEIAVKLISFGEYEQLQEALEDLQEIQDEALDEIREVMEIYRLESESNTGIHSEWFASHSWDKIQTGYKQCCDALLDLADCREGERSRELKKKIAAGQISHDAVRKAMHRLTLEGKALDLLWELPEKPLVSVVVCVYNGEEFVGNTLESIIRQSYDNLEIIVVDDSSKDGSRDIIREYAQKDSRVVPVFLEKNRNICYAGNVGFEKAQGKYVALIGHDDIWRQDKIEKQVSFLEEHPAYTVCFSWVDIIDKNDKIVNEDYGKFIELFCGQNRSQKGHSRRMLFGNNTFCAPSACIRREYLAQTGFYRYALVQMQDYDLWLRLLRVGNVYVIQEKLTCYRRFAKDGKNLSYMTVEAETRAWHENQWIQYDYIDRMSDELFRFIFRKDIRKPELVMHKAALCEKAFLLWGLKNCFAVKKFMELLEDMEIRELLENEYQFTLQDFYKMNTEAVHFDASLLLMVRNQSEIIEKLRNGETL